ncbi:ABC transporter ATP-binding protein [Bacillus horti]|uniref:NitT/TauT family transport system ATP-binding protein n=1 Tax=Caldalkalibacillus horti TaxID=77523 RepID=A0ABT9VWX3_9BACI|nr:ABC transporter ATP-binding protein [Bacillus horti]MDQ0165395.1 NitT/TauT family transport system ATP-binding protein [Bacillus horti]
MSTQASIELQHVSHVFVTQKEANVAIENISLTVEPGEFISLVGPSGCGKSTILSSISGLLQPTKGTIKIHGVEKTKPSADIGYMLQSDYLFEWKSILKNVLTGLKVMKRLDQETRNYANYLLHEMGLSAFKHHYPSQLSGGMRQRASLVRTLVTNPDILLLDEPFSALDYQTKLQLEDLVWKTLKSHQKTAVLVTHDIAESIAMSDRIYILEKNPGRIKEEIVVPEEIRAEKPFLARENVGFRDIFQRIWKELDADEG